MFGIGGSELVVIVLVALLVFGPGRIPEVMRTLSAAYRELTKLKRQVGDTVSELRQEIDLNVGVQDELAQALRPPTGARVSAQAPQAKPPANSAQPAASVEPEPAARQASPGAVAARADADDYLAPLAASAQQATATASGGSSAPPADAAVDDYLNGGRHE